MSSQVFYGVCTKSFYWARFFAEFIGNSCSLCRADVILGTELYVHLWPLHKHWTLICSLKSYKLQNSVKATIENMVFKKVARLNNMWYRNVLIPDNFPIDCMICIYKKKKKITKQRDTIPICVVVIIFLNHCLNQNSNLSILSKDADTLQGQMAPQELLRNLILVQMKLKSLWTITRHLWLMFGAGSLKGDFTNKQNVYSASYLGKLSVVLGTLNNTLNPQRPVSVPCPEYFQSYVFSGISRTIWQEPILLLADCNRSGIRAT